MDTVFGLLAAVDTGTTRKTSRHHHCASSACTQLDGLHLYPSISSSPLNNIYCLGMHAVGYIIVLKQVVLQILVMR